MHNTRQGQTMGYLRTILLQFIESIWGSTADAGGGLQLQHIRKINDSVYEFYSPPGGTRANVEIVFFHGLEHKNSSEAYVETWTSSDSTCWPKTWLTEKFPRARILSVSYDSCLYKGKKQGRLDLYCTAENLLHDLMDAEARVASMDGCPLVLVGKDLGGFVIKAICVQAKQQDKVKFLSNLKGIFFYCTPHHGVLDWPKKFDGALAKGLRFGNTDIVQLNFKFSRMRKENKWAAKAIVPPAMATKPQQQFTISEASARFDVDECYTAKEDIDMICKPRDRTSSTFTFLTEFISSFVGPRGGRIAKSLHFEDDTNYVPMRTTLVEVRRALQAARIVLLHGVPGSGKSSLARYLALQLQDESRMQGGVESTSDQIGCFPNGVVFLQCGNKPNIVLKQQELLRKFNMEVPLQDETALDTVEAREKFHDRLYENLREIRALVVLDDVWDRDLVRNLLIPGGHVKYLLTTQVSTLWWTGNDLEKVEIQNVNLEDARQILGNYASFPDGVIPDNLKSLADEIIGAAESHPLALATLAMIAGNGDRFSVPKWQDLKDKHKEYLMAKHSPAVMFDKNYPLSVHASMMFMVDMLDDDARNLLYTIALFDGPFIAETLVRLFLMYTQRSIENISLSRETLKVMGVVQLQRNAFQMWSPCYRQQDWGVLRMHGLRHHFILTIKTEDIHRIMNFLDDHNEFLHQGERSSFDLAIVLCALYGAPTIKQRAVEKMDSHFIWTPEDSKSLANALEGLVAVLYIEDETASPKSPIARAATEVLWKLYVRGEFDDQNINILLDVPKYSTMACVFLIETSELLRHKSNQPWVKALPYTVKKLLLLSSYGNEELMQITAMSAIYHILLQDTTNVIIEDLDFRNHIALGEHPGCYELLVGILAQNESSKIQELALTILAILAVGDKQFPADLLAQPGLLQRLIHFLSNDLSNQAALLITRLCRLSRGRAVVAQFPSCFETLVGLLAQDNLKDVVRAPVVAEAIASLPHSHELRLASAQFPLCLTRLVGLLDANVDKGIQHQAVAAITHLATIDDICTDMVKTPLLMERLVSLLSKDMEVRCQAAAQTIANLAAGSRNKAFIWNFPFLLDRLVGLLAQDVDREIQCAALLAITTLTKCEGERGHMDRSAILGLLEKLIMLLSEDLEERCLLAAIAIYNLAESQELMVETPLLVERLVLLLPKDMEFTGEAAALAIIAAAGTIAYLAAGVGNKAFIWNNFPFLLDRLVGLLAQDVEREIQYAALLAIKNLTTCEGERVHMDRSAILGLLEKLIMLLSSVNKAIQEEAVWTISSIATIDDICTDMVKTPLLMDRLVLLLSEDMEVRCEAAATTIANLAAGSPSKAVIWNFPLLQDGLIGLLAQDVDREIQCAALLAITNLTECDGQRVDIKRLALPDLLEKLIMLLSKESESGGERAALAVHTIGNLALRPEIRDVIAKFPSCLERVVILLGGDVDNDTRREAGWALTVLSLNPQILAVLQNLPSGRTCPQLLKGLVILLSSEMVYDRKLGLRLISSLAWLPSNVDSILRYPGFVDVFAEVLTADSDEEMKENAVDCILLFISACRNRPEVASFSGSIEELDKSAHVTGTSSANIFWYRSFAEAELKNYEMALMYLTKAVELDGNFGFFWQERGVLRCLMGDIPEALSDLNKSLEIYPDDYEGLKHRALVKYLMEDEEGACADAEKAIQVIPRREDYGSPCTCLGVLPIKFGNYSLK